MRFEARKIKERKFDLKVDDEECRLIFSGIIERMKKDLFSLKADIKGEIMLADRLSGEPKWEEVDENLNLLLSLKVYEGEEIDVIEFLDGVVDLDFILKSEIESIKLLRSFSDGSSS